MTTSPERSPRAAEKLQYRRTVCSAFSGILSISSVDKVDKFWADWKSPEVISQKYPDLDPYEVSKAAAQMESIVTLEGEEADCKREFHKAVLFKNRPMESASILLFAIWMASETETAAGFVNKVLAALSDPKDIEKPGILPAHAYQTFVPAIHLAAGLGLKNVVKSLAAHSTVPVQKYVNTWAISKHRASGEETKFCQAIHESSFAGHADVTLWLLKNGANALSRNFMRITPFHFLALKGIIGDMEAVTNLKMKKLVAAMVESAAQRAELLERQAQRQTTLMDDADIRDAIKDAREPLYSEADMSNFIKKAADSKVNFTPLEIAVRPESGFPQESVGLLAPCLYNSAKLTYFDDIKSIAAVTPYGALNLVKAIRDRGEEDQDVLKSFRVTAQVEGASNTIASIFYVAPEAASEMLEMLEAEPVVEDAHHPLPSHSLMQGILFDLPMITAYEVDATQVGNLKFPTWQWSQRYDQTEEEHKRAAKRLEWQKRLMSEEDYHARKGGIKRVNVKVSLMPNVADIDILMSLACLMDSHKSVMHKKTVQGVIFVLWENLIKRVWCVNIVFYFLDLLALCTLVLVIKADSASPRHSSSVESLALAGLIGGVVRSTTELCHVVYSMSKKRKEFEKDESMSPMWSLTSPWFWDVYVYPSAHLCLLGAFIYVHIVEHNIFPDLEKYLYCVNLLMSGLQFVAMLRFQNVGAAVYTIQRTAASAAAIQVNIIFSMIFIAVIFVLLVLAKGDDALLVVNALRGWVFADGDGFDGMSPMHRKLSDVAVITLVATFFFNVVVLNMIVAVYGNEYDKAREDLKFDFLRGRANYCTQSILESYIIPYRGKRIKRALLAVAVTAMGICAYASFSHHYVRAAGFAFGLAQRLLLAATIQSSWFSPEGGDSQNQNRYLWMCHDVDWKLWFTKTKDDTEALALEDDDTPADITKYEKAIEKVMEEQYAKLTKKMDKILDRLESQPSSARRESQSSSARRDSQLSPKLSPRAKAWV